MKKRLLFLVMTGLLTIGTMVSAVSDRTVPWKFTCGEMKQGSITLTLGQQPFLTQTKIPQTLPWTLNNISDQSIACTVTITGTDTLGPLDSEGKPVKSFTVKATVPAGGNAAGVFAWQAEEGTYSAFYPLRVTAEFNENGKQKSVQAIRVIETQLSSPVRKVHQTVIRHGVSLLDQTYHAEYSIKGQIHPLADCFVGHDNDSRCSIAFWNPSAGGEQRFALTLHPPYIPEGGPLNIVYPVRLPESKLISLRYGVAIRESFPPEPPSDGVTFRSIVTDNTGKQTITDEIHTDSKKWIDRHIDLTPWSGQEITLTIQVHPGPKNDTTCDGCFISALQITSGDILSWSDIIKMKTEKQTHLFDLGQQRQVEVTLGPGGFLDANIVVKTPRGTISYSGMNLWVGSQDLTAKTALFTTVPQTSWNDTEKTLTSQYRLLIKDKEIPVVLKARVENGMFVVSIPKENPANVRNFSFGPVSMEPRRIYFAHGYVVEGIKKTLRVGYGGHELSTSHVGFEFNKGPAILMASSIPPEGLELNPERRIYSLTASDRTKLALLPNDSGAFAAAREYREKAGSEWVSPPGSGVARKSGRLVFDIWGGNSRHLMENMSKIFDYGVTNALFIQHAWQRYGYDVRLPDIWEAEGDYTELRELASLCRRYDVPFALHDNYIDYYPDAEDFTYDKICFHENGTPIMAWINWGAEVLSYRWRPNAIFPALEKNLAIGKKKIPEMDAYFVDVFASIGLCDFYTREGDFYPRSVTQFNWKKCFEIIDRTLTTTDSKGERHSGITMSEAGDDSLIGSLDGADAQWRDLADTPRPNTVYLPCKNWARTPWYTMVNHTNYSRHGAGYSVRYQGGMPRDLHGIDSDDYLSAEILGGLDLMVDLGNYWPDAIRFYYLANHVSRRLADKEIVSVTFNRENDIENIARQMVLWSDGTKVCVNRGKTDWKVDDYILPQFGYLVQDNSGHLLSGVVCNPQKPSETVELSENNDTFYLGGRGWKRSEVLPIIPEFAGLEVIDNRRFKIKVNWHAQAAAPKDLAVFVHIFESGDVDRKGWYAGGEKPNPPTSRWGIKNEKVDTTVVSTSGDQILTIPSDLPSGDYQLLIGLFDSEGNGQRAILPVEDVDENRYQVAILHIERKEDGFKITAKPTPLKTNSVYDAGYARLQANTTPVSWHGVTTQGAVQVQSKQEGLALRALPVCDPFIVTLDENILGKITAIRFKNKEIELTREDSKVSFTAIPDSQPYMILKKGK